MSKSEESRQPDEAPGHPSDEDSPRPPAGEQGAIPPRKLRAWTPSQKSNTVRADGSVVGKDRTADQVSPNRRS